MENQSMEVKKLMTENEELKRALALTLNSSLAKRLKDALDRINSGDYLTEGEFFGRR